MADKTNFYAGLSGLDLDTAEYEFGDGILLRRMYAHLMCPTMLAFNEPLTPGSHHPGPWIPSSGSRAFDMRVEIVIPAAYQHPQLDHFEVAKAIVCLMRIFVDPSIALIFTSEHSLSAFPSLNQTGQMLKGRIVEIQQRHFTLNLVEHMAIEDLSLVKKYWSTALNLKATSAEFALALEVLDIGQFIPSTAMTLVAIWGALEAIFSPAAAELRFRISAMIAAYMNPPGEERLTDQRSIAKLYDMRSAAAHGKPKHQPDDLLASFELLRMVLIRIIDQGKVPSKDDLERMLFCGQNA